MLTVEEGHGDKPMRKMGNCLCFYLFFIFVGLLCRLSQRLGQLCWQRAD